jgi:AcrR family transcriptional regulator
VTGTSPVRALSGDTAYMTEPDPQLVGEKQRRHGYAPPANIAVGRRGLHTRERILECAAEVFLRNGYHATSIDTIARAADASRATIYQYFTGKDAIFGELSLTAEAAVLDHGSRLGRLGPSADGLDNLHRWLTEWADIYDAHAAVFAEFPGIGTATGLAVGDAGSAAAQFQVLITERLRAAPLRGLDPDDAAAVLNRVPHMVNLYRHREMFPLPSPVAVAASTATAIQVLLFPDTGDDVLRGIAVAPASLARTVEPTAPGGVNVELGGPQRSPIAHDVLTVSSQLFAERGYYAVAMEDIAAEVGVGRATLYRYFSTKDKILAELTKRALGEAERRATALQDIIRDRTGSRAAWMLDYVRFHRAYRGVIRAWFDGTVAEQLSDSEVGHGIGAMYDAVRALVDAATLPPGVDPAVATAVVLAILGRMTEPTASQTGTDEEAAAVLTLLMGRLLERGV